MNSISLALQQPSAASFCFTELFKSLHAWKTAYEKLAELSIYLGAL